MTSGADRQTRYRQRRAESGLKQVNLEVPERHRDALRALATHLRDGGEMPGSEPAPTPAPMLDEIATKRAEEAEAALKECQNEHKKALDQIKKLKKDVQTYKDHAESAQKELASLNRSWIVQKFVKTKKSK